MLDASVSSREMASISRIVVAIPSVVGNRTHLSVESYPARLRSETPYVHSKLVSRPVNRLSRYRKKDPQTSLDPGNRGRYISSGHVEELVNFLNQPLCLRRHLTGAALWKNWEAALLRGCLGIMCHGSCN